MPAAWSGSIQELSGNNQLIETLTTGLTKYYDSPQNQKLILGQNLDRPY